MLTVKLRKEKGKSCFRNRYDHCRLYRIKSTT